MVYQTLSEDHYNVKEFLCLFASDKPLLFSGVEP